MRFEWGSGPRGIVRWGRDIWGLGSGMGGAVVVVDDGGGERVEELVEGEEEWDGLGRFGDERALGENEGEGMVGDEWSGGFVGLGRLRVCFSLGGFMLMSC